MQWYNKTSEEVFTELHSSNQGLSTEVAVQKLQEHGKNELKQESKTPFTQKLLAQLLDPMIIILVLASVVSAVVGEVIDALIIIAIVLINTALSLYQEGKAEAAIEALQKMSSPKAKIVRDGKRVEIDSTELVPGDYVILETGDIIPADLRLVDSANLKIDESSLTGESVPVEKDYKQTYEGKMEIGDRENIAYSSTIVSYGRGAGVVVETGENTEIGKIATSISTPEKEQTPLQKRLAGLSKTLGILVIGICLLVLVVGVLRKHEILEMFMTSISLAVAAVPEGLPAIVTIVLSLGMSKMAEKNAIVKKLLAVETLGTTTVICSDKTGTLTQNEMTVVKAYTDGEVYDVVGTGYNPNGEIVLNNESVDVKSKKGLNLLANIAALTNDAKLIQNNEEWGIIGDPTEGALLTFAEKAGYGIEDTNAKYARVEEIPFDSDRKMMTTFHSEFIKDKVISFTKGAPDIVLSNCKYFLDGEEVKELTEKDRENIMQKNSLFARDALRVLAYAYREWDSIPNKKTTENVENDMILVGLTGMIDPARPEAKEAIKECKSAGIIPIMITGDHLETGFAIAKELGIATEESQAIMGRELNELSDEQMRKVVREKRVFTRVSPENKVQIVQALKEEGHITAMTGDGVNDAPAIKKAHIGIAMGITGTDVAKSTAEVILTDDNFATIVHAVEEGRIIYSNIKKFVGFLLSCNLGEVLIVFIAILLNLPVPLLPIQLLWLNLVTDSFPALALGVEKGEAEIMEEPPRNPDEPLLDSELKLTIAIQSVAITIATLGAYMLGLQWYGNQEEGVAIARTMAFATLIISELLRSYSARSIKDTLFSIGIFSNRKLVWATLLSLALTLVVMEIPGVRELFKLTPLSLKDWVVILVGALIPLALGEIQKVIRFNKTHNSK
ncbi:calcium-translocating P-type ATPase, PMCA-type [Peptoniphilus indolicus]|uniref:P-type Ca(2+) transporter n=2 Tax=Peptoniphilus indolicus TaxID=33030 RepID=G4D3Q8_9FIRM|nr:calcium-translocating P-type ATPase, PMCA-type [Peptoniphilus indolicus]EGY79841.1 P-type cation-transporting ATPase [Peptoniphilus indolicus ATCC 29427]SUB75730.1 Calcium-transporting ATPase lmo0841 [Peptoniphilus indolicus]